VLLLQTDLLVLVVTAMVFLAGFMSLRLHGSFADRQRTLDSVVASVTTTPGYAQRLTQLDQELALATRSDRNWRDEAMRLRREHEDVTLSDRDIRAVPLHPPDDPPEGGGWHRFVDRLLHGLTARGRVLAQLDCVARGTFSVLVALLALLIMLPAATWLAHGVIREWIGALVAASVGTLVVIVAWADMRWVRRRYDRLLATVALRGPTPTWWKRPHGAAPSTSTSALRTPDGSLHPLMTLSGHGDDALDLERRCDDGTTTPRARVEHIEEAMRLVPEWSTPHALLAYRCWHASAYRPPPRRDGDGKAQGDGQMEDIRRTGLLRATHAVELNPFDPGSRLLLAALTIDGVAAAMERATSHGSEAMEQLLVPLPFSRVLGDEQDADATRPSRWLVSAALRRAREASILVERRWGAVSGTRAATGLFTELDRLAVDYQLGRAYVLSACHGAPSSNASTAEAMLTRVRDGMGLLEQHPRRGNTRQSLLDHPATLALLGLRDADAATRLPVEQPVPLCVDDCLDDWLGAAERAQHGGKDGPLREVFATDGNSRERDRSSGSRRAAG
jgi:hypothetical protein